MVNNVWAKQLSIACVTYVITMAAYAMDWQADNHQVLTGDYANDGSVDLYLQPISVATQVEIPYGITVNLPLPSELNDTILQSSLSDFSLTYAPDPAALGQISWTPANYQRHFGDFNGDGYRDVLLQPDEVGGNGVVVLGFPSGGAPSILQTLTPSELGVDIASTAATLVIQDVNNDGLDDVLIQRSQEPDRVAFSQPNGSITAALTYSLCADSSGLTDSDCDNTADRYDIAPYDASNNASSEQSLADAPIGSISGSFAVTSGGKASYTVPLELVPGITSSTPELALSYSQQAGNGILGVGWFISGLSEISRCPTSFDQDGYINGVNFNSSDQYCLNGQRLIEISTNEYRTESETFAKIIASGTAGNGPATFTVYKASGEIETYGGTANSQRLAQSGSDVYTWAISRLEDRESNYATYTYHNNKTNGEFWIARIDYNGNTNAGQNTNSSVRFEYQSRTDVTPSYGNSVLTTFGQRVQYIKTYLNETLVRRYQLTYTSGKSGRSLVKDVQECLGNGVSCLPKTVFTWDEGLPTEGELSQTENASNTGFSASSYTNQQYHLGDVNGDGKADVVWTYRNNNALGRVLFLADSDGQGFTETSSTTDTGYTASVVDDDSQQYLMGDVNGDGKSDLIWIARHLDTVVRTIYLANSNGTGFVSQGYEVEARPHYNEFLQGRYRMADVNGDNLQDLVWVYHHNNKIGITTYLAQLDGSNVYLGKVSETIDDDLSPNFYSNQEFTTGDVNGDGKADLLWTFSYQSTLYRVLYLANSNGSGFAKISVGSDSFDTADSDHQLQLGDVNGDGKADLVWTYNDNTKLTRNVYLASRLGTSFTKKNSDTDNTLTVSGHASPQARLTDLNGDGRQDLVYSYIENTTFGWVSYLADMDGEGFTRDSDGSRSTEAGSDNHEYRFGDITGDGKADLVWTYNTSTGTLKRYTFTQAQSYPDHINQITDGLGNNIDIDYAYLADSAIYTAGNAVSYPLRNDSGLSYVVSHVEQSNGIGGVNTRDYRYKGARTHLLGRGFLGFEQRKIIDNQRNFTTTENYHQAFPLIGELSSSTTANASYTIEEIHNDWQQTSINSGKNIYRYLNKQAKVKRNLTNGVEFFATVVENTHNTSYGYLDQVVTKTGRGYSNFSLSDIDQTITTDYNYAINVPNWRIRFVEQETKTFAVSGETSRTVVRNYTPYNSNSLLTATETDFAGTNIEQTRTYVRDSFGNITSATVTGEDIDSGTIVPQVDLVNTYINGLYPDISTNAEGHTEQHSFDHRYGTVKRHKDANGLISDSVYDGFGHLLFERGKDGTQIHYDYESCSSCPSNAQYASYSVTKTTTHPQAGSNLGAPQTVTYFDAFERPVAVKTTQDDGTAIWNETRYDQLGRVDKQSQPYQGGDTVYWTDFSHDNRDRPILEMRPDGGQTQTEYLTNVTYGTYTKVTSTVKVPGDSDKTLISHLYQNSLSQLQRSTDAYGTHTDYDYDAEGNLREVIVNGDVATTITTTTDLAGNRTLLVDPDAGTISFEFDAVKRERRRTYGTVTQHSTTSHYDRLGRLTSRVDNDGANNFTANWVYDPSGAKGLLYQATADDYQKTYTYDGLARPIKMEVALLGEAEAKVFDYNYDAFSRPLTTIYPSDVAVTNHYNVYGYHYEVTDAITDKSYWKALARNAYGDITQEQYGNGVTTSRNFDLTMGRIASIDTGSTEQQQSLSYLHDSAGNLLRRTSLRASENLVENFVYDDLHRLDTAITTGLASGPRSLNYDYSALGNITTKSDISEVGGYSYGGNGGGAHAVSSITHNTQTTQYHYDFKGNMTTRGNQTLSYSVFNKPTSITEPGIATTLQYGPERHRFYQHTNNNGTVTETRYYGGGFQVENQGNWRREKTTIGDYLVIARLTSGSAPAIAEDLDYLHRDHLGSVEATSDRYGNFTGRFAFDPWGQRRQDDWENADATYLASLDKRTFESTTRGFTDHEHLDAVGLIHMNGRIYDPLIGRFLSPDDYVQNPESSQSYNRYSYVRNNPLSYTDPNGEFIFTAIAIGYTAVKIYDAVTTAHDVYQTVTDENTSTEDKARDLGTQLVIAAVPAPKFITKRAGKLLGIDKTKPKTANKDTGSKKSQEGAGSDKNTEKKAESKEAKADGKDDGGEVTKNGARGRASEARVLDDMGLPKNNTKVSTSEGNAIPDALTSRKSIEIKDCIGVSCTKQIRIQTGAAKASGRESVLVTGTKTKVTKPAERAFDRIIRRDDLGPQ